jgi:Raf kinase inhibitor-like YbhB/YbcL family protein
MFPMMLFVALSGCGAAGGASNEGATPVGNATLAKLSLSSDAFRNGERIPVQYTCDGANQTPALSWSEPPAGTKSFALVIDDPDAPSGIFRHWGVFDIPASARSIGGGQRIGTEVTNDFGKPGYGGPCPPKGHGPHHYHFKLFALEVERLGLSPDAKVLDVENAARQYALAEGELIGTYERK